MPFARASRSEWGKKTLVVKALAVPAKHTFRFTYQGRDYAIHLVQQERRLDILDKAAERLSREEAKYQADASDYRPPQPKKQARKTKMEVDEEAEPSDEHDNSDDMHEDSDEEKENNAEGDLDSDCKSVKRDSDNDDADAQQPADKTTGEAKWSRGRNGLPKQNPVRQSGWRTGRPNADTDAPEQRRQQSCWDKGRPSFNEPSAAAERMSSPAPQQSAFQAKLDEMEKQRANMVKASEDFKAEVNALAETRAKEMEALLTNLQALQTLVAKNQEEANERMKRF